MSTTTVTPARTARPSLVLAAVCVASILLPLSLTGASVALPAIQADLHSGLAAVQWVVNGYDLTFAAVMLATGALADRVGRRLVFVTGLSLFALCAVVIGVAPDIVTVDVARAVAGLGAAGVLTSGAAILAQTFQDAASRTKAFAALGTAFGVGIAFGPAISGFAVNALGWRGVFLAQAVVAAVVLAVVAKTVPESRSDAGGRIDVAGTVTFSASLGLLIFVLVQGPLSGWASPVTLVSIAAAVVLLAVFVVVENRSDHAMFDVGLLLNRRFIAIAWVPVALAFGFTAVLIYLPSYFASVRGYSAGQSGALLLLLTVPTLLLPGVGGWLSARWSQRGVLGLSLAMCAVGAGWLTVLAPGTSIAALVAPLVLVGAGFGVSLGILDGAAVSAVPVERAGMAAGMFNTMRLAGEVVAIAAMGSILVTATRSRLGDAAPVPGVSTAGLADDVVGGSLGDRLAGLPGGAVRDQVATLASGAYTSAWHLALWSLAAVCLLSTLLVVGLLRGRAPAVAAEAVVDDTAPAGLVPSA